MSVYFHHWREMYNLFVLSSNSEQSHPQSLYLPSVSYARINKCHISCQGRFSTKGVVQTKQKMTVSVIERLECHKEMHSKNTHYTTKQYSTKGQRDIVVIMSSTIVCCPLLITLQ